MESEESKEPKEPKESEESKEYLKYWKETLEDWDGTSKNTYNSNQPKVTQQLTHFPSFLISDKSAGVPILNEQPTDIPSSVDTPNTEAATSIDSPFDMDDLDGEIETNADTSSEAQVINYKIIDAIASGGMGAVFKGYQESLGREVAIKKLLSRGEEDPYAKERFVIESKITAYLDHPNIVPVYEIGTNQNGQLMLAMKLVEGDSWKKILLDSDHNDIEKNLQILLNVVSAIEFAHSKNIVHLDLKPDNIMVGKFREVLVMDWGIALDVSEDDSCPQNFTHKSMITGPMGTPGYMSPEQATGEGENIGPWTDIYLLGGILYEILMGTPPHRGFTVEKIVMAILNKEPLEWHDAVPEKLKKVCEKALAFSPQDRHQSTAEFRTEIEEYLTHRESITIVENSLKILEDCKRKVKSGFLTMSKFDRDGLYDDFAMAIAGFHQAIELWAENEKAIEKEKLARIEYAKVAIKGLDFGLARAQLKKLDPKNKDVIELQRQIESSTEIQECNAITKKLIAVSVVASVGITFRLLLSFILPPQDKLYFMQNNPASITACVLILVSSLIWIQIFRYKTFHNLKSLTKLAVLYEACGVILIAFMYSSIRFPEGVVPTGIFPPAATILLFRIIMPYSVKVSLIAGLISAIASVMTILFFRFFLDLPQFPELLILPYIGEHFMMILIGVVLAKMVNDD